MNKRPTNIAPFGAYPLNKMCDVFECDEERTIGNLCQKHRLEADEAIERQTEIRKYNAYHDALMGNE